MKKSIPLTITLVSFSIALSLLFSSSASAAFISHNLMEDSFFDNYLSMNTAQIDAFLNTLPNSCISVNSGFAAIMPTGYTPAGGFTYGGYVSAGQVIATAAQVYEVNPKVLITTLEKEQSLVTGQNSATYCLASNGNHKYAAATGYGCPDSITTHSYTGLSLYRRNGVIQTEVNPTCVNSSLKAGFSQQVIRAAWLLKFGEQRSKGNTAWNIQKPGWDNSDDPPSCYAGPMTQGNRKRCSSDIATVPYDGLTTIDGVQTHMDTGTTAALYWYTPHFHGNQLFVSIYEGWFGSPVGNLFTANGGTYLIENDTKRPFPSEFIFLSYSYSWANVVVVTPSELELIPDGAAMPYNTHFRDGHLVTSTSGGVYVIDNGVKRPFPNEGIFFSYTYKFTDALVISSTEIGLIPDGAAMPYNVHLRDGYLVTSTSGGVYVIDNGFKRSFPNEITFFSYNYKYTDALVISSAEISIIPNGVAMAYNTHFRDGHLVTSVSRGAYQIENGVKRAFPNELVFLSYSYKWSDIVNINPTEYSLLPDGAAMPYNAHFRDGHLVTSASGGIYVIDNGVKRPFPNEGIFFSYGYKFSDALVISGTELNLIPLGTPMPLKT